MVSNSFKSSGNSPTQSAKIGPDFVIENHGSICFLRPMTRAARAWVEEHIGDSGFQPYFPARVVVEPRFIADIVQGIHEDGLAVRG